jgi:hypothetical protein
VGESLVYKRLTQHKLDHFESRGWILSYLLLLFKKINYMSTQARLFVYVCQQKKKMLALTLILIN